MNEIPVSEEKKPESVPVPQERIFYEIDSSRISLREYSWGTPFFLLPLVIILKLLRIRLPASTDDPPVRDLEPFEVKELPSEESAELSALRTELESLGFRDPVLHRIEDPGHATVTDWVTYRHSSGGASARIHLREWSYTGKPRKHLFTVFATEMEDGRLIVSSSGNPDLLAPPSWEVARHLEMSSSELWRSHLQRLGRETGRIREIQGEGDLRASISRQHAQARDFLLARGIFAEARHHEILRHPQAQAAQSANFAAISAQDAAAITEIRRMENSRSGWPSLVLIACISVMLFILLGAMNQPLRFIILIVIVLFIHELGHFIAMKLMGYRNLRMFFIPFLGAAVSGRKYSLPGWKQILVSFSGPLPGIALGIIFGIVGTAADSRPVKDISILLLALNGFNLLPIMPLDGGRILHTILFCRNPMLNVISRIIAVFTLIALGMLIQDRIITVLGVLMAFGIPMAYKTSKIAARLQSGGQATAPDSVSIPDDSAARILEEIRKEFPGGLNLKTKAQMTMQIFETLNTRPPSWPISFMFASLLIVSLSIAVIAVSAMIVSRHGGLDRIALPSEQRPQMQYRPGTLQFWKSQNAPARDLPVRNILANFSSPEGASGQFTKLSRISPAGSSVLLFGQSVIISMPCQMEEEVTKMMNRLRRDGAEDVCSPGGGTDMHLQISFEAKSPEAAEKLEQELRGYFALCAQENLEAPWSKNLRGDGDSARDLRKARATYARLAFAQDESDSQKSAGEDRELAAKMDEACRRGDKAAIEELGKHQLEIWRKRQDSNLDKASSRTDSDGKMVEAYRKWVQAVSSMEDSAEQWKEISALMGSQAGNADAGGAGGGNASRSGKLLNVFCLSLDPPLDELAEIAEWLGAEGARDIRYNLWGISLGEDEWNAKGPEK